ncbi:hypothetical protein EW026_g1736 [Hermanssonia centrifuga]|uniref:Glucose-methanol-choline oxidoreductase N-terminal domain-containing protein n=1 Tax=Hermanssonia centrifuga TaxID=98765 RepID=A0A4S4KQF9_9APHY|nr:hypothetical protein EW026_g1736 [Hermanssonia centrifuga]
MLTMQLLNHALIVFSWATTAFAAIYEKFSDLPANKYDFVVVGGPEFISRPNLHVLLHAQVTRLIPTGSQNGKPTFRSVEFASDAAAPRHQVTASKEVILSAGSLETPHILLLSGIGDTADLAALNITPRVHLPSVGQNLSVHIAANAIYFVNSTDTFDDAIRNTTLRNELVAEWNQTHGGLLGGGFGDHVGFTRMPDNASIFETYPDPSAGPNTGHFQMGISNGNISPPPTGHFISSGGTLITPTSRGSIKLNTSNPFDQPLIDLACLTTDFDIFAIREGIKTAQKFLSAPAWQGYVLGALGVLANATTDAELEAFARANSAPNGHIVATASMSPKGADFGVVDPDLRVKGVEGLRVVDASVLPFVPAGNTQFAAYMVGERGADLIKANWQ